MEITTSGVPVVLEDEEIIKLYFERAQSAISETDKKYGAFCKSISIRLVGDDRDAEECVNDTYLKLWVTIPPQRPNSLCAFIGKIVRNLSLDCLRRKNAAKRRENDALPFEELSECIPDNSSQNEWEERRRAEISDCINGFLSSLPQDQRVYFMRRYWYGEPLADIAERYGIPANNLGVIMHRLRKKLKKCLEKSGFRGGQ
ncbi:MAG: RNA polymerase sigma factor [Oscillospiraceae bacterium]